MSKNEQALVTVTMRKVRGQSGDHRHLLTQVVECKCGCTQMDLFEMHCAPSEMVATGMWDADGPAARDLLGHPLAPGTT